MPPLAWILVVGFAVVAVAQAGHAWAEYRADGLLTSGYALSSGFAVAASVLTYFAVQAS